MGTKRGGKVVKYQKDRMFIISQIVPARKSKAAYMIVMWDKREKQMKTRFVRKNENLSIVIQGINNNHALTPLEVYNMSKDIRNQVLQARTWEM